MGLGSRSDEAKAFGTKMAKWRVLEDLGFELTAARVFFFSGERRMDDFVFSI